jgi:hypothetical protein
MFMNNSNVNNPRRKEKMKKGHISLVFFSLFLLALIGSLLFGEQQRRRVPWEERSPKVGKKVPDIMIYDKNLNKVPLSNLYKDSLLVIQWGGCT